MNSLKAIIMAGGEGSRLRPLTCDCPKPMLRLMGRPLMEYTLQLLKKHGVTDIAATLGYLPDSIMDYFGDGEEQGVQLRYFIEKTPLGTAGSVKQARDFLDETFIVLSGDGITDIDLGAALRFHREKGALATLILKKCLNPQEYGMVVADPDGRIRSFHEKPGRSDVYSDLINTGIYILEPEVLEHIPEGRSYDFGHDLFPVLTQDGRGVYGHTAEGYWCDVGDVGAYLRVHADALDRRIRLDGLAPCTDGAILDPGCIIEAPVYIAPGAHIASGARIGAYSVIGEGCFVSGGAGVKRSLLFPGARVEPGAQLRGCIAGKGSVIGEGAQLFEESVVGSLSRIGERAVLPPGVKLWPEKVLSDGERPKENIVWGSRREERFMRGAMALESPSQAARAAQACMAHILPREVIIGRSASSVAAAMWHAAASGAMAQGVQVVDAGVCSLPQLRHAQSLLRTQAALFIEDDRLMPLDQSGIRLSEKAQRSVLKLAERQDFSAPFSGITRPVISAGNTAAAYIADTAAAFRADPRYAPKIVLCAKHLELAQQVCLRAGLHVHCVYERDQLRPAAGEIGLDLSETSEEATLSDENGMLSDVQRQLACAFAALELGERQLILPIHATRAIDDLAAKYGAHALYLPGENALWLAALAEKSPLQLRLQQDGLYFALGFLSILCEKGLSLDQWRRQTPAYYRSTWDVQIPSRESGRLLRALADKAPGAELGGGVRLTGRQGWAWLSLDDGGGRLNITAEAAEMEVARELCDFYGGEIQRLLDAWD